MGTIRANFKTIPGTEAAEGHSGELSQVVDRPKGVAGGLGIGFNGGQLLALALGGCVSNDVRYAAHDKGVQVDSVAVDVDLEIEDGVVLSSSVHIEVSAPETVDVRALVEQAVEDSTIVNAVLSGINVEVHIIAVG